MGFNFGRANAVFFMSSSPLDQDDDEGLGDDDDFLEYGPANEESKMEEVSDGGFRNEMRHCSRYVSSL